MLDQLFKWLLRTLAVLMAFGACGSAVSALWSKGESPLLVLAIVHAAIAWALWRWSGSSERAKARRNSEHQALVDQTLAFFKRVNHERSFPEANAERVISRPDAPVLAACNCRVLEVTTEQARQYLGTRVKIAGMPIYLGQSATKSKTTIKETAQGELALTIKALIFSGSQKTIDLDLRKIVALDVAVDGITVSVSGRVKPLIFIVPNGLFWGTLLKNLTQMEVQGRSLPAGAQLQLL
jgi:hypothetical protein